MNIENKKNDLTTEVKKEVLEAEERIREFIIETRLDPSPFLSGMADANVYLKCDNRQITNSFKLRGAMNKILSLSGEERERGVTTASTGNHGSAVAYVLDKFGINGSIYLPENAAKPKVDLIRSYGADLKFHGEDCLRAELKAKETAEQNGMIYVSPYNDMKIVGGQGTIAVELMRQVDHIDTVICPVGGGGLISGIAGYLKALNENIERVAPAQKKSSQENKISINNSIEIIGAFPENCTHMAESCKAGRMVEMDAKPTVADGVEGALEPGAVTLDICMQCVDDFIFVSEEEIKEALKLIMARHFMLVEGAGALSTAAFIKNKERFKNKNVVLIISGGKIGLEKLKTIIC